LDGFQYEQFSSKSGTQPAKLLFFPTAEGYYNPNINENPYAPAIPAYVYNYTDHLGNVRVSYANVNGETKILEENNYYPFGMKHEGYNNYVNGNTNYKYKFQAQELQTETGWYSFKWRNYMPDIGRFFSVDPLSEGYEWQSVYVFGSNQPVHAKEIEGLESEEDKSLMNRVGSAVSGFGSSVVDNVLGTNLTGMVNDGSSSFRAGVQAGNTTSLVAGAVLMTDGASNITAGGTGLAASAVVATTGAGAPVGGVGAAASASLIAKGTAEVAGGAWIMHNAVKNIGKYNDVPNPKNVKEGGNFTKSQKKNILEENKKQNGGVIKSDESGKVLDTPTQSRKGEKANMNQAEIDHVNPKSKGGSNASSNAQILSKEENLKKGNR
jgi:RHS repeat-associated protein